MYSLSSILNLAMAFWIKVVNRLETFVPNSLYIPCVQCDGRQIPWRMKTGVVETFKLTTA